MNFPLDPESVRDLVAEKYENFHNPSFAKLLKFGGIPLEWSAEGAYIYDAEGNKYLDFLGGYGVFSLGHRHPKVVEAVKKQLDMMPMASKIFFNKPLADLAEAIAQIAPGNLQYSFICNSGTEAVEGALKAAKKMTGRPGIVSTEGSYHGKTMGALSATGREKYRKPFAPLLPGFTQVPYDDLNAMAREVNNQTAAVIIETVQGEGGIIVPDKNYLPGLREICDKHGALLIADEVQTGLGRTGEMFGVNHYGVIPDLMCLAKCLGGGVMPVGAFVGTPGVWDNLFSDNPFVHTSTFGGNPLACVAGLAALKVIQEENLVERSKNLGMKLLDELKTVQKNHPEMLVEARGQGLMVGVEFSQDEVGELVIAGMVRHGVIAAYTLNNPRVIRFEPPLIIHEQDINKAVKALEIALIETEELLHSMV